MLQQAVGFISPVEKDLLPHMVGAAFAGLHRRLRASDAQPLRRSGSLFRLKYSREVSAHLHDSNSLWAHSRL